MGMSPQSLAEAKMRMVEIGVAVCRIDRDLETPPAKFLLPSEVDEWRRRATTAREGYKLEQARLTAAVDSMEKYLDVDAHAITDARDKCQRLASELERKDEEIPISGPISLLKAVYAAGRKGLGSKPGKRPEWWG